MIKDALLRLLNDAGISIKDLSKMTGVPANTIYSYANGLSHPTESAIMRIAYELGISTDEVLDFREYAQARKQEEPKPINTNKHKLVYKCRRCGKVFTLKDEKQTDMKYYKLLLGCDDKQTVPHVCRAGRAVGVADLVGWGV